MGCVPSTCMEPPLAMRAAFGRTQYRRGAVVMTLKHTSWLYGFSSRMNCCACALSSTGRHRESAPGTAGRRRRRAGGCYAVRWRLAARRGDPSPRPCPPPPADRRASPCGRDGHRPRSRWRRGRGLGPLGRPPRGAGRGLGVARVNRSTAGSILSCGTSSFPGPAMAPEPERLPLPQSRQDTGATQAQAGLLARCSLG